MPPNKKKKRQAHNSSSHPKAVPAAQRAALLPPPAPRLPKQSAVLRNLEKGLAERALGGKAGGEPCPTMGDLALVPRVVELSKQVMVAKKALQRPVLKWAPAKVHFSRASDKGSKLMDDMLEH